jgi:hypothetical protein
MGKDWDPALWYWALPYDPGLGEWLKVVDPSRAYITAGREFGAYRDVWQFDRKELLAKGWLEPLDLAWQPDSSITDYDGWENAKGEAWRSIRAEIEELQQLMQDDRERYLAEIEAQADGLSEYYVAFIGASHARFPWTLELINCGLSIGNLVYSFYKQKFKRVRPSVLCPGLVPPFGPPAHPAFPSGHSFLGHFIALLLLEIPTLRQRYGMFERSRESSGKPNGSPGKGVEPYPTVTISQLSAGRAPVVISLNSPGLLSHGLSEGDKVVFQEGQGPITPRPKTYVVLGEDLAADCFKISEENGTIVESDTLSQPLHGALYKNPLMGRGEIRSPLFWLAQRMAKNRERLGVHYPSDSSASRHLAAAVWRQLLHSENKDPINSILMGVIMAATGEWPPAWPP